MTHRQIQLTKLGKHQLNNEGCKCEMCQKLIHNQTMKYIQQKVQDHQSQSYGNVTKQYYIKIIMKMSEWQNKTKKLRFLLPEICVYENNSPLLLITKKGQNFPIKVLRDKSKLHMFEITQFFLQGFIYHNPQLEKRNHKRKATSFLVNNNSEKYKNECVVIAKYKNNLYNMLTLTQIQSLFKSRHKYMRDGLMYVQTLVHTRKYSQTRINLNLRQIMKSQEYERAKILVKILHQVIKSSDMQYITDDQQIIYENKLKNKSMRQFLEYLTVKIVLAISKLESFIISQAIFKYVYDNSNAYLIDVRVSKIEPNQQFWASAAMKAFQYKLSRRMSMMDVGSTSPPENSRYSQSKAKNISMWLQKSTEVEWNQMKIIRARLQKLQRQKKSLMESQSFQLQSKQIPNKTYKIRSIRR